MDSDTHTPDPPVRNSWGRKVLSEVGLISMYSCSYDVKIICFQRFVRLFAYGGTTLILAAFLSDLGHSDRKIGLFMTLTLVGDIVLSLLLTIIADGIGRRIVLAGGAALMVASGTVFVLADNYWALLAAAVFGIISPAGNEIGPFRAIEESTIAWLTKAEVRSDIFAWYSLLGSAGTALGMLFNGWLIRVLQTNHNFNIIKAYRVVFMAYAVMGIVKFCLALMMSSNVENQKKPNPAPAAQPSETDPLLPNQEQNPENTIPASKPKRSILPKISKEGRVLFVQLCLFFMLDSFASGLVTLSWTTYFFKRKFSLQEGTLGTIFSITSAISAASVLVASSIAKRIGNVKAMAFTHLPSTVALALIPIPATLGPAVAFLVLRACCQQMDVAPRTAFLAAVLPPNERTAIMGTINVAKTGAQSLGPLITGVLASAGLFWVSFVAAGSLKLTYDLGILAVFASRDKRPQTEAEDTNH